MALGTREITTLLCFDYGSKRIGAAVGQTITGTASPLQIINSLNNKPDWEKIEKLISDWRPDAIIVGIPLQLDGSTQLMTEAAEGFARHIENRFHLPVFGMDERLSTFEARERSGSGNDMELDSIAAQAILESWMRENTGEPAAYTDNIEP